MNEPTKYPSVATALEILAWLGIFVAVSLGFIASETPPMPWAELVGMALGALFLLGPK
jgi:hypothetical protein